MLLKVTSLVYKPATVPPVAQCMHTSSCTNFSTNSENLQSNAGKKFHASVNSSDVCFFWHDDFPVLIRPEGIDINQYSKHRITLVAANSTSQSNAYTYKSQTNAMLY